METLMQDEEHVKADQLLSEVIYSITR